MPSTMKKAFIASGAILLISACHEQQNSPSAETINLINLKKGEVVWCGPSDKLGKVDFKISASEKIQKDFDLGIALLHSFEYDEAEKVFAKIITEESTCAIAYWGVAMSNFHPLWTPPTQAELEKGSKAIAVAQSLKKKTARESDYIEALASFYKDWDKTDHLTRCLSFEKAMENIYKKYPSDKEAAIFYALALNGAANPADKTFTRQKKAGKILTELYPGQPEHPGIIHYIIHSYDYPELALQALDAAKKYAAIAPASAHAQHMPSHIFTRLGLWDECIQSNLVATSSAKCYAESTNIRGHWDEELHGLDYLVYSYLQKGDNKHAKEQYDYLKTIESVDPVNFKVAYAFAAIPARYLLENKLWKEAVALQLYPPDFPWQKFPWQKAIVHFTRALGCIHTGNIVQARLELKAMNALYDTLSSQKDTYKMGQVQIQAKTVEAWILLTEGKKAEALKLMSDAADMEDNTEKHPVTPCEVIPARELLADMLLQMNKPEEALKNYEADLKVRPNRFNDLYGAAVAAEKSSFRKIAYSYYQKLIDISVAGRPEVEAAKLYLVKN